VEARPAIWTDAAAWKEPPALVVIRSCWDYHRRLPAFFNWLDSLAQRGIAVVNAPDLIRWNARKSYLLDLIDAGFATGIPTALIGPDHDQPSDAQIGRRIHAAGFDASEIVVKPEVSASAWQTHRLRPLDTPSHMSTLRELVAARNTIVQPFVPEILTKGELSLVYFGGRISHAVRKLPADGDFRVQEEHGGTTVAVAPPPALEAYGRAALDAVARLRATRAEDIVYARVDVVNALPARLMEIELIEPALFLGASAGAAAAFAAEIVARLER
jgi:glutathione synthase/RimK-type ligase-like ATP-grasp enzyme